MKKQKLHRNVEHACYHQRLLWIDADTSMYTSMATELRKRGYEVLIAPAGTDAVGLSRVWRANAVILEKMLTGVGGLQVCRALRAAEDLKEIPILFLSAAASERDRLAGFKAGANDYLSKPITFGELAARLRIHIRKWPTSLHRANRDLDPVRLYPEAGIVEVNGNEVSVTKREWAILDILTQHCGAWVSRESIIHSVWPQADAELRTVDAYISRLRRKLNAAYQGTSPIESRSGFGYRIRQFHTL